jgi:TPR repeat protein
MRNLDIFYEFGREIQKNEANAIELYEKAVYLGNSSV